MSYILGVDPGSRITGYGVIHNSNGNFRYIASGCIRTQEAHFATRLKIIFVELTQIVEAYPIADVAVEKVFVNKNVDSALKLGQARGAAICACVNQDREIYEYTPAEVKNSRVGTGRATKDQMQHMVRLTLGLNALPQIDAADALAIALCHGRIAHARARIQKLRLARGELA